MNKLIYFGLLIFIIILFQNCDGRDRAHKTTDEALIENKLLDSFSQNVSFYPKNYSEVETDTILPNGFKVKIKAYTDMESHVPFSKVKGSITYTKKYRNFKFDIIVEKDNTLIYQEHFDKDKINNLLGYNSAYFTESSPFYNFDKLAILKSIQVDDELSLKNEVLIDILYAIPNSNRLARHTLFVNENGETGFVIVDVI